jgi:protoporphyrinogen oxidase
VYRKLVARESTASINAIRYTALVSAVCATAQELPRDFYWLNLASLRHSAAGLFVLSSLNPTLGAAGEICLNFVTHLRRRDDPFFALGDEELWQRYGADFERLFGFPLERSWSHVTRVPLYSPVFSRAYEDPPVRSETWSNVYFAGNYRTFPSVASTGTALASGLDCARAVLRVEGLDTDLPEKVRDLRVRRWPRG